MLIRLRHRKVADQQLWRLRVRFDEIVDSNTWDLAANVDDLNDRYEQYSDFHRSRHIPKRRRNS